METDIKLLAILEEARRIQEKLVGQGPRTGMDFKMVNGRLLWITYVGREQVVAQGPIVTGFDPAMYRKTK